MINYYILESIFDFVNFNKLMFIETAVKHCVVNLQPDKRKWSFGLYNKIQISNGSDKTINKTL